MKLKKAIKLARKIGFNWIAVDYSGAICAYSGEPKRLDTLWDTTEEFRYIGRYTGGKSWEDTLRQVLPVEDSQTNAWVHEIPVDLIKYAEGITLKELNQIRYFVNRMITKEENLLTTGHSPTNGE